MLARSRGAWEALGRETLGGIDAPIAVFRPVAQMQPMMRNSTRYRARDGGEPEPVVLLSRDRTASPTARRSNRPGKRRVVGSA